MLLDRISQRKNAIRTIGAEAAERASALGIEPVRIVYPEPEMRTITGRMTGGPEVIHSDVTEHTHRIFKNNKL